VAQCTDVDGGVERTCDCGNGKMVTGGPFTVPVTLVGSEAFTGCSASTEDTSTLAASIAANPDNIKAYLQRSIPGLVVNSITNTDSTVTIEITLPGSTADEISTAIGPVSSMWAATVSVVATAANEYTITLSLGGSVSGTSQLTTSLWLAVTFGWLKLNS